MTDQVERKRENAERLHVALLIDESGSMGGMGPAVIAGVNEFINDLKADPAPTRVLASLAMFDLRGGSKTVRPHFTALPIEKVRPLGPSDYSPHGSTPLNDAVAQTIGMLDRKARKSDRVMLVILTDGYENASKMSSTDLRKRILDRESKGWEFIYLGANQDTWTATEGIGLDQRGKHFAWEASPAGVEAALKVSGDRAKRFRDAPDEYRAESSALADEIAPGEVKVRELSREELRRARGRRR